ncbi:MAG: type IV pilus secretin PilQ [Desulfonatronovibrio sp.]
MKKNILFFMSIPVDLFAVFLLLTFIPVQAGAQPLSDPGTAEHEITGLDFWTDEQGHLYVDLQGRDIPEPSVRVKNDSRMEALIPDFKTDLSLTPLYRLDEFEAGIKSLFLQNTESGTRLIWNWNQEMPFQVSTGPDSLTYEFAPAEAPSQSEAEQNSSADVHFTDLSRELPGAPAEIGSSTLFPGMKKDYTGDLISVDLQDAEVEHVIRLITSITDYNLVLDEDVTGRISLRLKDIPWDQALDLVLIQKNLGMVHQGNIIRITTAQKLEAEQAQARRARQAEAEARKSIRDLEPLEREFIQINYSTANEMLPQIKDFLSDRGKVSHDPRTNTLIVQDTSSHIDDVKALIENLDRPEKQVYIEARVVYASEEFTRGLGIGWNFLYPEQNAFSPNGNVLGAVQYSSMNFPAMPDYSAALTGSLDRLTGNMFSLDAELRLGESQNQSRTISAPKIITLNNVRAEIEQGVRIRRQVPDERGTRTEYEDAVLRLAVQPQITADNRLILDLELSDDSPAEDGINTRLTRTKFLIENGETIVIGGIMKTIEEQNEGRIPGLGTVPVLGWLFKNQHIGDSKNELLIFIRPEIL